MKKFELTTDTIMHMGIKLFRIKSLINFGYVKAGDVGGFVESENNLSQDGEAWVCGNAKVYDNADYLCFKGLGSSYRHTTFFKTKDGNVFVKCGCFIGTLDEFVKKVKDTHGDSKYAREYLTAVEVVKIHFDMSAN